MDPIPGDIVRFMQANIESLEQLELLRVLSEDPHREWKEEPLGTEAQAGSQVTTHLTALSSRGLVTVVTTGGVSSYRHGGQSPQLNEMLGRLLQAYKERPVTMIRLVYAQAKDPLRAFADAFRLRKEE
jgi:hypothetical protein